jgi:hypothetical protein
MLKITTTHDDGFERVLKLEGKLLKDWVDELQEACSQARAERDRLKLDLSEVLFVDVAGTIALRVLIREGVAIISTSPFIRELLKEK